VEPQEYDEIIRHLVRIAAHQDTINADLRESIQDLREFNRQQVDINRDVKTTLARVETLLARMIRHQDNGQDA
jgi:hypothetical protein